ncbi:MAG: SemiSWEET transporter [Elusimicrobiota bacterium]
MNFVTILGLTAGTLTTFAFLPQLFKAWKSKSTSDISLGMFIILCAGILLWIAYGFFIKSFPVIISNAVTFILCMLILYFKIKYK